MTFVDKFLKDINLADDAMHYFSSTALLGECKVVIDTMGFAVDYRSSMPVTSIVSSSPFSYIYSSDTLRISYTFHQGECRSESPFKCSYARKVNMQCTKR